MSNGKTEHQKMLAGELYDPMDPELVAARGRARDLCQALNATREAQQEERRQMLNDLFGAGGNSVWMQPPFFCDYGSNIELGERVFFNFNCIVLDVCRVCIGSYTLFGPAVQVYTPMHPFNAELRRHEEFGRPVRSDRTSGWVRGNHSAWRENRIANGDRRRKRGDAGRSGGHVCRGEPMPCRP
jgi:maltose O-acetyltransferase